MRLISKFIAIIILLVGLFYADTLSTVEYQNEGSFPEERLVDKPMQSSTENTDNDNISIGSDTADTVNTTRTPSNDQSKKPITLLGWIPYWDQENAFTSFKEQVELFSFVSVFWYRLDHKGNITTYETTFEDKRVIDFAHNNNVKVLAIIANLPDFTEGGDWDFRRVNRVIHSREVREKHIASIIELVNEHEFDGINIDYEALIRSQRDDFSIFIQELANALHAEGKLLAVAIHPKTSEGNPQEDNGSAAQDWKALYPFVDQLHFMLYGEHYSESPPGPIASISWVSDILTYAIDTVGVPREKIFLGMPLYAQEWHETASGQFEGFEVDYTYNNIQDIAKEFNADKQWDNESQSPYLTYGAPGDRHIIWYENGESFEAKLNVRERFGIPNVALWRLGIEDPVIWSFLQNENLVR